MLRAETSLTIFVTSGSGFERGACPKTVKTDRYNMVAIRYVSFILVFFGSARSRTFSDHSFFPCIQWLPCFRWSLLATVRLKPRKRQKTGKTLKKVWNKLTRPWNARKKESRTTDFALYLLPRCAIYLRLNRHHLQTRVSAFTSVLRLW
jgi:hypothetical protein